MNEKMTNGRIKSKIAFLLDKMITLKINAALIPIKAISKKLSNKRWE